MMPSEEEIAEAICNTVFGKWEPEIGESEYSCEGQSRLAARAVLALILDGQSKNMEGK